MPKQSFQLISDTLSKHLQQCTSERLLYEVGQELDVVGANIVDVAKELAPYRTGFLRDSIYHRVDGTTLEVGATADYASYQEFGTHKTAPHSFLIPALDANLQNFVDAVRAALLNALGV